MIDNILFFSLHRYLSHGVFKQLGTKYNICRETVHVYHDFGHNFCSEMIYLVTNTLKQIYFSIVKGNQ